MDSQATRYHLLGKIILNFLGRQEQTMKEFCPEDGVILEVTSDTIWVIYPNGEKVETIDVVALIPYCLRKGLIKEIK